MPLEARSQDSNFLADGGGRRWLTVRVSQHRYVGQLASHAAHLDNESLRGGEPDLGDGALDHEGIGEVVDVLGGASEMHQLGEVFAALKAVAEPSAHEVLDCFDVVHRLGLDGCQLGDRAGIEVLDQPSQAVLLSSA